MVPSPDDDARVHPVRAASRRKGKVLQPLRARRRQPPLECAFRRAHAPRDPTARRGPPPASAAAKRTIVGLPSLLVPTKSDAAPSTAARGGAQADALAAPSPPAGAFRAQDDARRSMLSPGIAPMRVGKGPTPTRTWRAAAGALQLAAPRPPPAVRGMGETLPLPAFFVPPPAPLVDAGAPSELALPRRRGAPLVVAALVALAVAAIGGTTFILLWHWPLAADHGAAARRRRRQRRLAPDVRAQELRRRHDRVPPWDEGHLRLRRGRPAPRVAPARRGQHALARGRPARDGSGRDHQAGRPRRVPHPRRRDDDGIDAAGHHDPRRSAARHRREDRRQADHARRRGRRYVRHRRVRGDRGAGRRVAADRHRRPLRGDAQGTAGRARHGERAHRRGPPARRRAGRDQRGRRGLLSRRGSRRQGRPRDGRRRPDRAGARRRLRGHGGDARRPGRAPIEVRAGATSTLARRGPSASRSRAWPAWPSRPRPSRRGSPSATTWPCRISPPRRPGIRSSWKETWSKRAARATAH